MSFYEKLGRFNAVLFAGIGLLLLAGIAVLAYILVSNSYISDKTTRESSAQKNQAGEKMPMLAFDARIAGTDIITFEVRAPKKYYSSAGSFSPSSADGQGDELRNILFLNTQNGNSRYLLGDNSRYISEWHSLKAAENSNSDIQTHYVAFVAKKDEPASMKFDILVGRFADAKQSWVLSDVARLVSVSSSLDGDIILLYFAAGENRFARIDGKSLQVQMSRSFPVMPLPNKL